MKLLENAVRESAKVVKGQKNSAMGNPITADGAKYRFKGYDKESGRGIYEGNFPLGTPKSAKAARILEYIQTMWSKKPIDLVIKNEDGTSRHIQAKFDPSYSDDTSKRSDATKLMGGNRHGSAMEQRVTLDLADDYYQIAEESTHNYSKAETGKASATHRDVKQWHYFINDILFQQHGEEKTSPYRVTINVKERTDGSFVYSFNAEKQNEGSSTRRTLHADVNQTGEPGEVNAQPFDNSIPGSAAKSNHDFSLKGSKEFDRRVDAYLEQANKPRDHHAQS